MTCLATPEHLACTSCALKDHRKLVVPGHGNPQARIALVGEAPGREEDERQEPFVGRAGRHLDELLERAGLSRAEVWLTNVLSCHPPQNDLRPWANSLVVCPSLWLDKELGEVGSAVVVALGLTAASRWLPSLSTMREAAGVARVLGPGRYVLATYHPSYALRPGGAWADAAIVRSLRAASRLATEEVSDD